MLQQEAAWAEEASAAEVSEVEVSAEAVPSAEVQGESFNNTQCVMRM